MRWTSPAVAHLAVALGVAGVAVAAGLAMPLGPLTTAQSVTSVLSCLVVGVIAGFLTASRWWILLAPVVFAVAFELARLPASGPTIDTVRLDTLYGVLTFLVGRGVDAVLLLFPLAVGALWGAAGARRRARARGPRRRSVGASVRLVAAALVTAVLVILVVALLRPATTAPITGSDGSPVPGSVAELATVRVGGHDQALMIRGADRDNPVLLFLEGGPGGTALGAMRASGQALEADFVVAVWDQRGSGKSMAALEPAETLTVEQMVRDTLEVTDYLRQRFGRDRVYLVGSSWGTTLGVLAVQRAPEKFHAFVGSGQMVDQQETDRRMYAETLDWAERSGDEDFARRLRENGPPPYEDTLAYPDALSTNPEYFDYPHGEDHDPAGAYPASFLVEEYTLTEQLRGMGAILNTFAVLYPQLQDIDFRRDVPELEVPVFVVEGSHESPGRSDLVTEWFEDLEAPVKELVVFDRSGHTPHLDEPARFHAFMTDTVLAETDGTD